MCGIIGVSGRSPALPILLDGLARLEYRGYDSAGVALLGGGSVWRRRRTGRLAVLAGAVTDAPAGAATGIGHTRWATHGCPDEANAHPHLDCSRRLAVVHNGIIENHRELRDKLEAAGHRFTSGTDSEVLAHLVEDCSSSTVNPGRAVEAALGAVEGSFALAVVDARHPNTLVVARRGSPLVVGRTETAGLVASDVAALFSHTAEVYAVGNDQVVEVRPGSLRVIAPKGAKLHRERRQSDWSPVASDRGDYAHFMLKEIHEQPRAIAATLGGRRHDDPLVAGRSLGLSDAQLGRLRRVVVVGCGTSLYAGMAARAAFESWARLPVECDIASEFRYRDLVLDDSTLVVGVSQSGETIDTIYALREARRCGAPVVVVTNVPGSAMARDAAAVLVTRAGPEVGVAATKTHAAQVVALQSLALTLGAARAALPPARLTELVGALEHLPVDVEAALARADDVDAVARRLVGVRDFFFLGRGPGYAVALEGALKLKEIAYVRAEAYAAGEMKHGPIALIEPGVVVVAVAGNDLLRAKTLSNIAEVRARGATVVVVAADDDTEAAEVAEHVLRVPRLAPGAELLSPVVEVVPLQLLAYTLATAKGYDVDKPRNLAKTVTVE